MRMLSFLLTICLLVGKTPAQDSQKLDDKAKHDAVALELKKLSGTWITSEAIENGKSVKSYKRTITIDGDRLTLLQESHEINIKQDTNYLIKIDSTSKVKAIDFLPPKGEAKFKDVPALAEPSAPSYTIYSLEGDELKLALIYYRSFVIGQKKDMEEQRIKREKNRPVSFDVKDNDDYTVAVIVLKRQKK